MSLWLQKQRFAQIPQLEGAENRPMFGGIPAAPIAPIAPNPVPATPQNPVPPVPTVNTVAPQKSPLGASQIVSIKGENAEIAVTPGTDLVVGSIFETANSAASLRVTSSRGREVPRAFCVEKPTRATF